MAAGVPAGVAAFAGAEWLPGATEVGCCTRRGTTFPDSSIPYLTKHVVLQVFIPGHATGKPARQSIRSQLEVCGHVILDRLCRLCQDKQFVWNFVRLRKPLNEVPALM